MPIRLEHEKNDASLVHLIHSDTIRVSFGYMLIFSYLDHMLDTNVSLLLRLPH